NRAAPHPPAAADRCQTAGHLTLGRTRFDPAAPPAGLHGRKRWSRQPRNAGSTDRCSKSWTSRRFDGRRREIEVEDGAAGGRAAASNAAAERVDDAVADREPEAGALPDRLGREERLKQLGFVVGGNAGAGILDF